MQYMINTHERMPDIILTVVLSSTLDNLAGFAEV